MAVTDETDRLSAEVASVLQAAVKTERAARGDFRRVAFRNTRYLIFGAIANGALLTDIAQALGLSIDTIRSRAGDDGVIAAVDFTNLTGIPPERLNQCEHDGLLNPAVGGPARCPGYLASELIKALQQGTH